jgi:hypothetical protein
MQVPNLLEVMGVESPVVHILDVNLVAVLPEKVVDFSLGLSFDSRLFLGPSIASNCRFLSLLIMLSSI